MSIPALLSIEGADTSENNNNFAPSGIPRDLSAHASLRRPGASGYTSGSRIIRHESVRQMTSSDSSGSLHSASGRISGCLSTATTRLHASPQRTSLEPSGRPLRGRSAREQIPLSPTPSAAWTRNVAQARGVNDLDSNINVTGRAPLSGSPPPRVSQTVPASISSEPSPQQSPLSSAFVARTRNTAQALDVHDMDESINSIGRVSLSGSPPPTGSQTVPAPVNATTRASLSPASFHAIAGPHVVQTGSAPFSAEQLREIDRRQELIVQKFLGYFKILDVAHGGFRDSISQMDKELKLLRETVSSLSTSSEERFQNSEPKLKACSKLSSERIADLSNLSNTNLDSRFQEMINSMNFLSRTVEDRLQAIENRFVSPAACERASNDIITTTAGKLDFNMTSKEELHARHQAIDNSRQLPNTFEQRHKDIERRIMKSEERFTAMGESFTAMNELLSMEIATREQDYRKLDQQCEGKGALQTKGGPKRP